MRSPVAETVRMNLHLQSGKTPLHILKDVSFSIDPGEVVAGEQGGRVDRAVGLVAEVVLAVFEVTGVAI